MELFKQLPNESVDLIVTDPPYNIANDFTLTKSGGKVITTKEAWGKWDTFSKFDYELLMMRVFSECYRVLKKGGSMYMFTANEDSGYFVKKAEAKGFRYRSTLAILKKNPQPSYKKNNWRTAFELCMYLTKGQHKTFNFSSQRERINVFEYVIGRKYTSHPTEKPSGFIKRVIQASSNKGDVVLDPFMGSGTTAVVAKMLERNFIGAEISKEYVDMANRRLKAVEAKMKKS